MKMLFKVVRLDKVIEGVILRKVVRIIDWVLDILIFRRFERRGGISKGFWEGVGSEVRGKLVECGILEVGWRKSFKEDGMICVKCCLWVK